MIRSSISEFDSVYQDETPEEGKPPLSPQNGAESLFLAGLATSKISANALALRLKKASDELRHRTPSVASFRSVLTDDFHTCVDADEFSPMGSPADTDDEATAFTAFTSAKTIKKLSIPEEEVEDRNMPVTTAKPATAPTKAAPKEEGMDVAENVYAKAKDVWAWGKGVPLVGIGLGITEAVAGKVASVAGTDLSKIDEQIKPQLATLDSSVINPAIVAVVGAVMGAAGKTGDFVHPILVKVLSPFGLLKNEPGM